MYLRQDAEKNQELLFDQDLQMLLPAGAETGPDGTAGSFDSGKVIR